MNQLNSAFHEPLRGKASAPLGSPPPGEVVDDRPVVLFVAFQAGKQANGGIQSLTEILGRLRRVRPIVVTQLETPVTAGWRKAGHEVHLWPLVGPQALPLGFGGRAGRRLRSLRGLVEGNLRVARFLRDRKIRVVHCNDGWASMYVGWGARSVGARVVLNIRDTLLGNVSHWKLLRALSSRVVVLSEEMRAEIERRLAPPSWALGAGPTPVTAVYSIVDPQRMRPLLPPKRAELRAELGIADDEIAVGVVGALMAKKQQLKLIEKLNQAESALSPKVKFYFVGDFTPDTDDYCRRCQRAAQAGALRERIVFVGYTPTIERWHQALDIGLMASEFEGLARSMIESVACATPVVALAFCSAREILEQHRCGLVAPMHDFDALVAQLSRVVDDPGLRSELALSGPALARRAFAPDRIAGEYEQVYLELAAL